MTSDRILFILVWWVRPEKKLLSQDRSFPRMHSLYILGDTTRPRHIAHVQV